MAGQGKTDDFGQLITTATPTGFAAVPAPDTTSGKGRPLLGDGDGRAAVRLADGAGWVDRGFTVALQTGPVLALAEVYPISAVPCLLQHVYGHKSIAGTQYLQIYNQAGGPPAAFPAIVIPLVGPADQVFAFDVPWVLSTGCVVAISTSRLTFTGAGAILYLQVQLLG